MDPSKYQRHEPEEPEHISCEVCLKEIPASTARSAEGEEYVHHFCGVECLERWREKQKREEETPPDRPGDV